MAQSGYTPILIYASGTTTNVPLNTNLTSSSSGAELAINYADGKLFYKDSGGTVQVLATKGTGPIGGSTTQVQYNNAGVLAGSANLTFDGTTLTANNITSASATNLVLKSAGTTAITVDTSQNVGIGTTSPSKKLEVYATSNSLQIESIVRNDQAGSGVAAIGFNVSSGAAAETTSTKAGIGLVRTNSYGVGSLCFYNNGTTSAGDFTTADERMRIDSSGNVGIGTTSPNAKLTVTGGNVYNNTTASGGTGFYVYNGTTVGTSISTDFSGPFSYFDFAGSVAFRSTSSSYAERMRIDSSGNLGIGNTPSGTYKLEVSGLVSDTAGNVRSLPLNSQTAAYIVAATDNGKVISITTGGVTVNNSIMSAGMVVTIYNNSGSSQTITQGTGVTLQWAGQTASTTGTRTLGLYGMATVFFLSASSAVITGSGLT